MDFHGVNLQADSDGYVKLRVGQTPIGYLQREKEGWSLTYATRRYYNLETQRMFKDWTDATLFVLSLHAGGVQ